MFKLVKVIKQIEDRYDIPVNVYKLLPELDGVEFLTGGFYVNYPLKKIALFPSDEEGNIISEEPLIIEEGFNSVENLFKFYDYTLID